jgi:putative ABC transport system permease protein
MNLWQIAWGYLWNRKLTTVLTILSVALAVGLISAVLTLRQEVDRRFAEEGQAFDLVVGAEGRGALELVLSCVYFIAAPYETIPYSEYERIKHDEEYVRNAFPLTMGDNYLGYRIVGTEPGLFDHTWESTYSGELRHPFALAEGRRFAAPMEAVVGAMAARKTGLEVGDTFIGDHGLIEMPEEMGDLKHTDHPYTVVGILEPSNSPFDRVIYTSLESTWHVHEHFEDEYATISAENAGEEHGHEPQVTAVLVQLKTPLDRFTYEKILQDRPNLLAAIPILIVENFFSQFIEPLKMVLMAVGYLVVIISALSILIGLYMSIIQRKRDLAIMRALGASSVEIFGAVIIEAFWVTMLGIVFGWALGRMATYCVGLLLANEYGFVISAIGISSAEMRAFASVAMVGLLAGILPAWQAYDSDVAHDLADRQ